LSVVLQRNEKSRPFWVAPSLTPHRAANRPNISCISCISCEIEKIKSKHKIKHEKTILKLQEKICRFEVEKVEITRSNETTRKSITELQAVMAELAREKQNHEALKATFNHLKNFFNWDYKSISTRVAALYIGLVTWVGEFYFLYNTQTLLYFS